MIQSVDFSQIMDADEVMANWEMLNNAESENIEELRSSNELNEIADFIEAKDLDFECEDLINRIRDTADFNPLSETAIDLKFEAIKALKELR